MTSSSDPTDNKIKVRLRFKEYVEVAGEAMWALPVDADDSGGTYILQNNSFFAPLGVGDLVRAELDGDGLLQVTDVVMPSPSVVSAFMWDRRTLSDDQACAMADAWRDRGASWTEGTGQVLVTIWNPQTAQSQVLAVLEEAERAGRGEILEILEGEDRTRGLQTNIDFELNREPHVEPTGTTYWAADDPYWAEHGLDSPDFLAFIQWLASVDDLAAKFCESGEHNKVLEIVAFMTGDDPRRDDLHA